jgi:hypothetical protein
MRGIYFGCCVDVVLFMLWCFAAYGRISVSMTATRLIYGRERVRCSGRSRSVGGYTELVL